MVKNRLLCIREVPGSTLPRVKCYVLFQSRKATGSESQLTSQSAPSTHIPIQYLLIAFLFDAVRTQYSDWLRAGWSGDRIPAEARFSAPVQTGPGTHPASCTMGTGSFPGVKSGLGVTLTPHPLLVPLVMKE